MTREVMQDFVTFPHYFSETLRLYRHVNVVCLNTVAGNMETFIKRNFRVRLITNTVFPGAYEFDLALIDNDHFLLTNVDLRRLQQIAETHDFDAADTTMVEKGGVRLPSQLWDFVAETKQLPLSDRTPYHRATLHYFLWQICKYFLLHGEARAPFLHLSDLVRFYLREVRRPFRTNREVNEAHLQMARETLKSIAARVLIADLPPVRGYEKLPPYLQLRETLVSGPFSLLETLPPYFFFGSRFDDEEQYVEWVRDYLADCSHIQFWLLIVRDEAILPALGRMLDEAGRKTRVFRFPITADHNFTYVLAQ
jgi:hypothetical protein